MTGKTHKAVGICIGIAFSYWGMKTYNDPSFAISTLVSAAGSMLPDIDHNSTRLGARRKFIMNTMGKALSILFIFVILALSAILALTRSYMQLIIMSLMIILSISTLSILSQVPLVRKFLKFSSKHRGIMHTLAIPSLLLYLSSIITLNQTVKFALIAMAVGYLSHLVLDCFNKRGCPILWPLVPKNISFMSIKVGSAWEYVVSFMFIFIILFTSVFFNTIMDFIPF